MSFGKFCSICFTKENIIKLCGEENEPIMNILISFTSCPDIINGYIYLCTNCCNKLEEYDNFREMCLTNFVRFRYLYNEQKKQLEIRNAPDIEIQLKAFVDVNVERPSGTPLIENCEAAQALRKNTTNVDVTYKKESDGELKIEFDELVIKNDLKYAENITLENNTEPCHQNYETYSFHKNQENNSNCVVKKSPDQLVSDTVGNATPCHESADDDTSDVSFNPEDCATDNSTDKEGSADKENEPVTSDILCNVCDKNFSCKSDLDVHLRTHTSEKHYKYAKCQKTFTDTANLKIYDFVHSGKIAYKCDECDYACTVASYLKSHKRTHTGEKPYKCDECDYTCIRGFNLKAHKRRHTGEKPYKCDECGLEFTQSSTLNRHKLTHTGEKAYKCDECDYTCKQRSDLKTHKRRHTGEKPYKCDECDYTCTQRSNLKSHKRRHTGEKPYKCDVCGFRFTHTHTLKVHKHIHTGEKPYKCAECGLDFKQRSSLKRHKLIHTGEIP